MGSPYQCERVDDSILRRVLTVTDKDFLCCPPNYHRQIEAWGRKT